MFGRGLMTTTLRYLITHNVGFKKSYYVIVLLFKSASVSQTSWIVLWLFIDFKTVNLQGITSKRSITFTGNPTNQPTGTMLQQATLCRNRESIEVLLENRVGIDTPAPPSVTQGTPLQAAIASTYVRLRPQGESLSLMKLFLGKGALPHSERPHLKSALERLISISITSMLRALLAARARTLRDPRVDVNYSSKKYRYALHAVVEHAEFDVL
jgi:hypothetical protein